MSAGFKGVIPAKNISLGGKHSSLFVLRVSDEGECYVTSRANTLKLNMAVIYSIL
jgi:hypothetical protein